MTNTLKLKEKIDNSGYKKEFIAEQLGITRYALQLKVEGKNEFKGSEIKKLCALLKIDSSEMLSIFFDPWVD